MLLNREQIFKINESLTVKVNDLIWIHHPITEDLTQVIVKKIKIDKLLLSIPENSPYFGQPDFVLPKINVIGIINKMK